MIMASPRRLMTTQTWTLVRQTATKVPSTAVDKLSQIMMATVGEVKVLLFPEGRDLEENIKDDSQQSLSSGICILDRVRIIETFFSYNLSMKSFSAISNKF